MALHPNWRTLSTAVLPWKTFVREGAADIPQKKEKVPVFNHSLTGDEAKEVYEEILKSGTERTSTASPYYVATSVPHVPANLEQVHNQLEHGRVHDTPTQADKTNWINRIMKAAQNNNVSGVSSLLKETSEFSINTVDQYGWTVLMCAAGSGSLDVVKFLIRNGADIKVKDKSGNCCLSIAKKMKHFDVANYIAQGSPTVEEKPKTTAKTDDVIFYCDVCKRSFSDEREKHQTSTVHLFNSHPGENRTHYLIPESNKGFQILLKAGWDKERGLGPEGSGHKFPLKTILRQDRLGLGQPVRKPARVTHFDPFSTAAVRTERKSKGRRERESVRCRERRKERLLRRELS